MSNVIRLRHGDSFKVLLELEEGSVGAIITDPELG